MPNTIKHNTELIKHNTERKRFETTVEGQLCVADYRLADGVMVMTHTLVPRPVEGRGIAASLVAAALDHVRKHNLKVDPQCSYVRDYMHRHPETQSLHV
ncbi:MAG: N-acetyltransferase [Burkholderiales bacterium]|nr:N-acetyltransferase [Burkholderiales bacterium]